MKPLLFLRILFWVVLICLLPVMVRSLLPKVVFHPTSTNWGNPGDVGLEHDEVELTTSDGVRLNAWYVPAKQERATLLFFHGNAGNITDRLESIKIFNGLGLSVFIIDYRGFGKSAGSPSLKGVGLDARAAWNWLTIEKNKNPDTIIVFGRSLGGAVAIDLASEVKPAALIIESTFASLPDMVLVPALVPLARILIGDWWNSEKRVRVMEFPAFFAHSPDDEVVPYAQGRRVYDAYLGEKEFLSLSGGHNDGFLVSRDAYVSALDAFLAKSFPY